MALALVLREAARRRGFRLLAAVCDHGLRSGSLDEALLTRDRLQDSGIEARVLRLRMSAGSTAVQQRARSARHAALTAMARREGLGLVAFGHHLMDQAETVAQRMEAGASGPSALAGIRPARVMGDLLYVRPLLRRGKGELRDLLREERLEWVEDPSNENGDFTRVRLRRELARDPGRVADVLAAAEEAAGRMDMIEAARDAALPSLVLESRPWGSCSVRATALPGGAVGWECARELLRAAGGRAPEGNPSRMAALLETGGTLGGVICRVGAGGTATLFREARNMPPAAPARPFGDWDGRVRAGAAGRPGGVWSALGDAAATALRRTTAAARDVPHAVLATVPCLRDAAGRGISVPQMGIGERVDILPMRRGPPLRSEPAQEQGPPAPKG